MKNVVIVGSTGSLGRKAVDLALRLGYHISALTGFKNCELLNEQIALAKPDYVFLDKNFIKSIEAPQSVKVLPFEELENYILDIKPDIVLFLSSGVSAIRSIKVCMDNNIRIGIANKESIIAGGELLFEGKELGDTVIPIDSETSAIFQLLKGEENSPINRLIITASGGPLFGLKKEELASVDVEKVLHHPNWQMGSKITVDSATLVNKAFEIMESHFLFNVHYDKIEAVVHRESIIHAMVEFEDKIIKALMSVTEMGLSVQYALTYPERKDSPFMSLNFADLGRLTFYKIDRVTFPLYETVLNYALSGGSYLPSIVAIDEEVVQAFLRGDIGYLQIEKTFNEAIEKVNYIKISTIEDIENEYNKMKEITKDILRRKKC